MLDDIVEHVYVINMKKHTERLERFRRNFDGILNKYELVEGIDVDIDNFEFKNWCSENNISNQLTKKQFDWNFYVHIHSDLKCGGINTADKAWNHWIKHGRGENRQYSKTTGIVNKGQWGCLKSHINVIKNAIAHNYETVLILEDDCIPLMPDGVQIKKYMQSKFMLTYLGAAQDDWDNIDIKNGFYIAKQTRGTFAYIVHRSFYKELLTEFESFTMPTDLILMEFQKKYEFRVIYPNTIICNLDESETGIKRDNIEWGRRFRWLTNN